MKIKLTTTYENCDEEFIDWYCKRLDSMPDLKANKVGQTLLETGHAEYLSSTKEGKTLRTATTVYEVIK